MSLFEKPRGVQTRWFSFENSESGRGRAGLENKGAKGHAFDQVADGETKTLLNVAGSGTICRIWLTINDRSHEMLRGLRLDVYWDNAVKAAVSASDSAGARLSSVPSFRTPKAAASTASSPCPFAPERASPSLTRRSGH